MLRKKKNCRLYDKGSGSSERFGKVDLGHRSWKWKIRFPGPALTQ